MISDRRKTIFVRPLHTYKRIQNWDIVGLWMGAMKLKGAEKGCGHGGGGFFFAC